MSRSLRATRAPVFPLPPSPSTRFVVLFMSLMIRAGEDFRFGILCVALALFALHRARSSIVSGLATNTTNALACTPKPRFRAVAELDQSAVQGTPFFEEEPNRLP